MHLILPSLTYRSSYTAAQYELQAEGRATDIDFDELETNFEALIRRKLDHMVGLNLPDGFVPATEFWMVDQDEFVGRILLRHRLTPALEKFGGNIGYIVRPSSRKKGVGSLSLRLVIPEAKKLGLARVLLTCDDDNLGSIKIIESAKGYLQDVIPKSDGSGLSRRYWIDL